MPVYYVMLNRGGKALPSRLMPDEWRGNQAVQLMIEYRCAAQRDLTLRRK